MNIARPSVRPERGKAPWWSAARGEIFHPRPRLQKDGAGAQNPYGNSNPGRAPRRELPTWSPGRGKWITYVSDESGETENLDSGRKDGKGAAGASSRAKLHHEGGNTYYFRAGSGRPDSKKLPLEAIACSACAFVDVEKQKRSPRWIKEQAV